MAATHYGVMDPAPCPDLEPVARERVASGFRRSAPVDAEPRGRLQTGCRLSSRKPPRGNPESPRPDFLGWGVGNATTCAGWRGL